MRTVKLLAACAAPVLFCAVLVCASLLIARGA